MQFSSNYTKQVILEKNFFDWMNKKQQSIY